MCAKPFISVTKGELIKGPRKHGPDALPLFMNEGSEFLGDLRLSLRGPHAGDCSFIWKIHCSKKEMQVLYILFMEFIKLCFSLKNLNNYERIRLFCTPIFLVMN